MIVVYSNDANQSSKITYVFFIASLFLEIFFRSHALLNTMYIEGRPKILAISTFLLLIIPSYPFSLIVTNMNLNIGYWLNELTMQMEK